MNSQAHKKLTFDQGTFKILYGRYKGYLLPIGVLIICFFLIVYVLIPQLTIVLAVQKQLGEKKRAIATLSQNIHTLQTVDNDALNADYNLTTSALPPGKDFVGILTAIANASANAGVSIGDYSFSLGDLTDIKTAKDQLSIELSLQVTGDRERIKSFIVLLQKEFPLANITNVSAIDSEDTFTISTVLYYRPLQRVAPDFTASLADMMSKDKATIMTLSSWKTSVGQPPLITPTTTPISSQSAR